MNVLYCDLFNGISGDMLLSAFIDAGMPVAVITDNISKVLNKSEFEISTKKITSKGLTGIVIEIDEKPLDDRNFKKIESLIISSNLNDNIKNTSVTILKKLAEAEAKIHNQRLENVHFHEIGAIDTIIDIVGIASCMDYFRIADVFCSEIPVGSGAVKCSHGEYPNPAPATVELLKNYNIRVFDCNEEIVTPTGAAILSGLNAVQTNYPLFEIDKIGYGFGKKEFENKPNCLRIFIGKKEDKENLINSKVLEIEFNIDDMTGEEIGFFISEISKKEILDIQCINSVTKKNRPSHIIKILTNNVDKNIIKFIFDYTTTGGLRLLYKDRIILNKNVEEKIVKNEKVKVKKYFNDSLNIAKEKVEFSEVEKLSLKKDKLWQK